MYLPYAPIAEDVNSGTDSLYSRDLAVGLAVLYLVLALLSFTTTRRLRRHAERKRVHRAHDALTDLPNRRAFVAYVDELVRSEGLRFAAVAIIDLDRFKDVNDTLGHDNGDELLRTVGQRLVDAVRPGDLVARLGGDEFGVVLSRVASRAQAESVLHRLQDAIAAPIDHQRSAPDHRVERRLRHGP